MSKKDRESIESLSDNSDSDEDSDESDGDSGSEESGSEAEYGEEEGSEYDGEDSDSEMEKDSEEEENDTADGEALGIDLSKWMKKNEFMHYKAKIKEKIDELVKVIEGQEQRLLTQVS